MPTPPDAHVDPAETPARTAKPPRPAQQREGIQPVGPGAADIRTRTAEYLRELGRPEDEVRAVLEEPV